MPWMMPVVLKNLFSRPATRMYPYQIRPPFAGARGRVSWEASRCDFCGDCARLCPAAAIEVDATARHIRYQPYRCIYCHLCAEACWEGAITVDNRYTPAAYEKVPQSYSPEQAVPQA